MVNAQDQTVAANADAPTQYIEPDTRFNADVQLYTESVDHQLRELLNLASGGGDDVQRIRTNQIGPLNESLGRVFGNDPSTAIQLVNWIGARVGTAPVLEFSKGTSRIPYDLLSHGEKQVVVLLLNFMVRRDHLQDKVIFIDEMDNHMHRALQYRLLDEIVATWIPDSSQLWTASHALGFIEFARARAVGDVNVTCLLDRDFLTEQEMADLRATHSFVRFVPTYCIENELYHPDNVAEASNTRAIQFEADAYRAAWVADIGTRRGGVVTSVGRARQSYQFFFDDQPSRNTFVREGSSGVADLLLSDDFDVFFPVYSAKDHGSTAKGLIRLTPAELASTNRFRSRIASALGIDLENERDPAG